ncbi:large ribosomal subunit protein bL33m [Molossus nigricans]
MFLSAISCKWGWKRGGGGDEGGRQRPAGPGRRGGGAPAGSGCGGLAGLRDYSARHAPRRASPRRVGRRVWGQLRAVCGSRGRREWGAFPALCMDVSAEPLDVRTGKNLRTWSSKDTETASVAKSKSKTILVRMVSQAGTGYSFNTKRSRLREKLTLLHYDPVVKTKVLFVEQKKIRSL